MSRSALIFIVIFCLLFQVSIAQKLSPSEKSFIKIKQKPGIQSTTLSNDFKNKYPVMISFPNVSNKKYRLIIALHWAGGGDTYKTFFECLALPGLDDEETIIVSPEGQNQLWNTGNNINKVKNLVGNAIKYWNVDANKIAVTGYSNGGNGSWYFAEHYPELFSAAIPMASSYPINKKLNTPLYVIHGGKDELFSVTKTSEWVEKTKEAGSNIRYIIIEERSHFQGCSYVPELKKAQKWLQNLWKEE